MTPQSVFGDAKYVSLRSFKKDGSPVDTPVWFACVGDKIVVFTDGASYKVKRLRRDPRVELALCDVRGRLRGPWHRGRCAIVDRGSGADRAAYAALNTKYGLLMRAGTLFATLAGRAPRRLVLEIELGQ